MAQTVIGMFKNSSEAQEAVEELIEAGISRDRIDVSTNSSNSSYSSTGSTTNYDHEDSGITKFFKSLFGDDDDNADKYSRVASRSQSIITVHAQSSDEAETVADILDDNGAVDVDESASQYGYTSAGNTSTTGLGSTGTTGYTGNTNYNDLSSEVDTNLRDTENTTGKIPIIEESLEVGKREVTTGGVRLRSRIIERPVEESVRLREERVTVERTPVDRAVTDADLSNFQERDIEMVERAEVPVVNKQARVVEEVSLGKEVEERTETVSDTLRKTEVDVENLGKSDTTSTGFRNND